MRGANEEHNEIQMVTSKRDPVVGDPEKVGGEVEFDDDERPKRTGTIWTTSAHIITTVIGSGVLSLPWCAAQLGWIAGAAALLIFSVIAYMTSCFLADSYRFPDPVTGTRNYTYMEAVRNNLGPKMGKICGLVQYMCIVGYAIGYSVTAAVAMVTIYKSTCFSKKGHGSASCDISITPFIFVFGAIEIILSQIPNFHKLSKLSTIAAIMSFCYASVAVGLSMKKVIEGNIGKTTFTGVDIGPNLPPAQKIWKIFSAIGDIELAYAFTFISIEMQDTIRAPKENEQMKRANLLSVITSTVFYALCACTGYIAFGNEAPGNILTGFDKPLWLINISNACIVVHLLGACQVFNQPLYAAVETCSANRWPTSKFIKHEYPCILGVKLNLFRLVWRSLFVMSTTLIAVYIHFFNEILAFMGALSYWPLTVYFPIAMFISQKKIKSFTGRWIGLQIINIFCFICGIAAACGSIQGIIKALEDQHHS